MNSLRQRLTATRLLGRDAVVAVSLAVSGLIALLPVLGWSGERTALVSAALVAVGGVVSAWLVAVDRALPLLVGLGKAVVAAVAGFGVHLPDNQVAALMAALTLVAGLATRAQVGAEQPARDRDGNDVDFGSRSAWTKHFLPELEFLPEMEHPGDDTPLPPVPERTPRPDDTMTLAAVDPATDYLPAVSHEQVPRRRPTEQQGRHAASWWPEPRLVDRPQHG